jgi:hypothetical protein
MDVIVLCQKGMIAENSGDCKMEGLFLYPIGAMHTAPLVRGIAKAMARCHAICDIVSDITLTEEQVHSNAVVAFKAFCEGQETEYLTDDLEALEALYVDAYVGMYHQRYAEILKNLEKIARERNLNCAD